METIFAEEAVSEMAVCEGGRRQIERQNESEPRGDSGTEGAGGDAEEGRV